MQKLISLYVPLPANLLSIYSYNSLKKKTPKFSHVISLHHLFLLVLLIDSASNFSKPQHSEPLARQYIDKMVTWTLLVEEFAINKEKYHTINNDAYPHSYYISSCALVQSNNLLILTYDSLESKGLDWVTAMKAEHKIKNKPFFTGKNVVFISQ